MDILRAENLCISFGGLAAVKNVSFTIPQNKIISLIGPNGAGKTTIFNIITGFYQADSGTVELCGEVINHISPERRIALGMARTFQNVRLFRQMTVLENLELGAFNKETKAHFAENLEKCYNWFPKLRERAKQAAGTLSGGEQQMVAVARALIGMPKLLILDEPSLGLAPNIVDDILEVAKTMVKNDGISVLLVEQDITKALAAADRGYVIENGRVALEGTAAELSANEHVKKAYLGI